MNKQSDAFRWAAILEHKAKYDGATDYKHKAAAELRRLHEENKRLRLAVAAEREECAKVCDKRAADYRMGFEEKYEAQACAYDIRARSEA